jgi:hypothetical protein
VLDRLWRPAILVVAVILAARVAFLCPLGWNPDEVYHLDAMVWFYGHAGVPALDTDGLHYSPDGWSRVWNGEFVYLLVGRAAALWHHLTGIQPPLVAPRLFNTALLLPLLVPLLWGRSRLFNLPAVGALMAGVPQIVYVFGYANSDAWAILLSMLLLLSALHCFEGTWPVDWPLVGALSALVLMAKSNAWFVLPAAWTMFWLGWRGGLGRAWLRLAGAVVLAAGLAAPVVLASRLAEPYDWAAAVHAQKQRRASPGFNPDHPTWPSWHLRSRGVPLTSVLLDPDWYRGAFLSTWATFGYMNTTPPHAAWVAERLVLLGLVGCAVLALGAVGGDVSARRKKLAVAAFGTATFVALLAAAVGYAWIIDRQSQGRHLLPGVFLCAVALVGVRPKGPMRRVQQVLLVFHVALGWAVAAYLGGHIAPPRFP